jgi:TPR repeat protein
MLQSKILLRLAFVWLLVCAPLAQAEKIKPIANEEQGVLLSPGMAELMEEANAGDAEAAKTVGVQYEMGLSVVQNYDKALEWYLKAVEMGSVEAL